MTEWVCGWAVHVVSVAMVYGVGGRNFARLVLLVEPQPLDRLEESQAD